MMFNEVPQGNGTIQVEAAGHKLVCPVCQNTTYHERNSLIHTRLAAFFRVDWASGDTATRSPDLPVFVERDHGGARQPGVEHGHHVHSDGARVSCTWWR